MNRINTKKQGPNIKKVGFGSSRVEALQARHPSLRIDMESSEFPPKSKPYRETWKTAQDLENRLPSLVVTLEGERAHRPPFPEPSQLLTQSKKDLCEYAHCITERPYEF